MNNRKIEVWHFLYREWSKLHDLLYAYDRIYKSVEIKDNRYNAGFQLILDSLTRNLVVTVDLFFQKGKRFWSLYSLNNNSNLKKEIDKTRKRAEFCIKLRNNHFAHLPKKITQSGNYRFLNKKAIKEIEKICESINDILLSIGRSEGRDESYAMGFVGVQGEINLIMNDLEK